MPRILDAAFVTLGFLWRVAIPVMAVAVLLGAFFEGKVDRTGESGPSDSGRVVSEGGDDIRVTTGPPGTVYPERVIVRDGDRNELLTLSHLETGSISLNFRSTSARASAIVKNNGTISFGTTSDRSKLTICSEMRPDGSAVVQILNVRNQVLGQLRIAPEGYLVEE